MDKINFKIEFELDYGLWSGDSIDDIDGTEPILYKDGLYHKSLLIHCIINGEEIKQTFCATEFLCSNKTGIYELFTCSCGIAGCAGIWDGVSVKSRRHTIEWRTPIGSNYSALSKRFYSFKKEQYDVTRHELYKALLEYSKNDTIHDQLSYGCDDYNLMSRSIKYYTQAFNGTLK